MKLTTFFCAFLLFSSCHDRKLTSSDLFLRFENQTSQNCFVTVFPLNRGYGHDTIWFNLSPGQFFLSNQFVSDYFLDDPHLFDTFDPTIYPVFNLDSAQVIFSDSLLVTHYSRLIAYDSIQNPTAPIYYPEARNIFNFDNYSIEKINSNDFEATYIFTESDFNYADSIHQ